MKDKSRNRMAAKAHTPCHSTPQRANSGEMLDRQRQVEMEQRSKGECPKQNLSAFPHHRPQEKSQQEGPCGHQMFKRGTGGPSLIQP